MATAGPDGITLTRKNTMAASKGLIDLKSLDPDPDHDGRVSASEAAIHKVLLDADVDKDGWLSLNEFYTAMTKFSAIQSSRELFKRALCGMSFLFLLQTSIVAILVIVVAVAFKDTYVANTTSSPAMTTVTNEIIGTAEALVSLPLFVAPVLPMATLSKVKSIVVSYKDDYVDSVIKVALKIAEVRLYSDTKVTFITETSRRLEIDGGKAYVVDYIDGVGDELYDVCEADVSCAAIKADAEDEDALVAQANDALELAGYPTLDYTSENSNGRRLADECTSYQEGELTTSMSAITALSTEKHNFRMMLRPTSTWQRCLHPKLIGRLATCLSDRVDAITSGDSRGTCDLAVNTALDGGGVELTTKEDGSGDKAWCGDSAGKYNVKCETKWGRGTQIKKFLNAAVLDAAFFCGLNENDQCVIKGFRRGCFQEQQMAAAMPSED